MKSALAFWYNVSMKHATLAIALSIVFSVCSLGINILYLYYLRAVFIYGMVISGISILVTVFCMIFSRKRNKEQMYYKVLMMASMLATVASMGIPVIATMIILFA